MSTEPSQSGQNVNETVEKEREQRVREQRQQEIRNKQNNYDNKGFIANRPDTLEQPIVYKGWKKEKRNLKRTFEKTRYMLDVPEKYYEKYKDVLNDKKTHLIRLQPDKNCYSKYLISVEELERCSDVIPIPGGGSVYSFKDGKKFPMKPHEIGIEDNIVLRTKEPELSFGRSYVWNIHFINDNFIVQNNYTRGIISDIGDVDLNSINLASKELEFLNNFKQGDTLAKIKEQSDALKNGVNFNNFIYSNTTPVKLNSTYVLRSIDYAAANMMSLRRLPIGNQANIKKVFVVDKRADLMIAFKVVGRENDGSIIILWKELKAGALPN